MSGTRFGNVTNHGDNSVTSQGNTGIQDITMAGREPRERTAEAPGTRSIDPDRTRNVFVVHGRDAQVRRATFDLLRLLDLHPLEWEDLVGATGQASPFIGDVVAAAPAQAQAALVLLTPDDLARLHSDLIEPHDPEDERRLTGQARPNVLLELGMVLMAYPERTLIVEFGTLRRVTDIAGRNIIRFDGSSVAVGKIVTRLKTAGCRVNDDGSDWRDLSAFTGFDAYTRGRDS